ncbi:MAG: alcohol dehydrogenase catalytic domain-containing protein [Candidatus Aminicenantes bacterium]|jgi:L-iditol 2-dehydrogenase
MKSVRLSGIRRLEIEDLPEPKIENPTDVFLRVEAVGLCGSDLHYFLYGGIGDQVVQYPFTIGHECAAEVKETGPECTRVKPGDKVVVDPAVACGNCDQCRSGRRHTCRNLRFLGCPGQMEGCLSEFLVLPEVNCYPVSEGMTAAQKVLVEPLSIGLYAVNFLKDIQVLTIGILGSGPIGLSAILAARASGIQNIFATDKIEKRVEAAKTAGAVWAGNPDKTDIVKAITKKEVHGLDAVLECCGDQEALDQGVELLKPGGRLLILGIPETDRITFDVHKMRRKEISLQNVRRQNRCVEEAVSLIQDGRVNVDFMATHAFSLEEAQKAFELLAGYADGVIKASVRMEE